MMTTTTPTDPGPGPLRLPQTLRLVTVILLLVVVVVPLDADRVVFRNGRSIEGRIISQSRSVVRFRTRTRMIMIPKRRIRRLIYGNTRSAAQVRKERKAAALRREKAAEARRQRELKRKQEAERRQKEALRLRKEAERKRQAVERRRKARAALARKKQAQAAERRRAAARKLRERKAAAEARASRVRRSALLKKRKAELLKRQERMAELRKKRAAREGEIRRRRELVSQRRQQRRAEIFRQRLEEYRRKMAERKRAEAARASGKRVRIVARNEAERQRLAKIRFEHSRGVFHLDNDRAVFGELLFRKGEHMYVKTSYGLLRLHEDEIKYVKLVIEGVAKRVKPFEVRTSSDREFGPGWRQLSGGALVYGLVEKRGRKTYLNTQSGRIPLRGAEASQLGLKRKRSKAGPPPRISPGDVVLVRLRSGLDVRGAVVQYLTEVVILRTGFGVLQIARDELASIQLLQKAGDVRPKRKSWFRRLFSL